jgi:hypothetical protein
MCLIEKMSFHRGSTQRGKGLGGVIGSLYKGVLPAEMMVVERKLPPQKDLTDEKEKEKEKTVKKVLSAVKITPKEQKTVRKEKRPKVEQSEKISKKRKVSYGDIFDAENSLSNE